MSTSLHPRSHNQNIALGPKSRAEFERSKAVTPGGSMRAATYFAPHPPYAASGSGPWVTDVDGRRIFDCANNFFSLIHGHAFPPVVAALHDAIDRGTAFGLPLRGESDLGEELRRRAPRLEQVRFVNSGTEAVMFAVKAARAITGRPAIAKIEGAYHGAYDHVEVSLDSTSRQLGDAAALRALCQGHAACRRCGHARPALQRAAAVPRDPAGARPSAGGGAARSVASRVGMVPASAAVLRRAAGILRKHGILLIMDEVISFAWPTAARMTHSALEPDLVALAKIIGGGLPIGAVAGPGATHGGVRPHLGQACLCHTAARSAPIPCPWRRASRRCAPTTPRRSAASTGWERACARPPTRPSAERGLPAQMTGFGSLFRLHPSTAAITDYRSCFQTTVQKTAISAIQFGLLSAASPHTQLFGRAVDADDRRRHP